MEKQYKESGIDWIGRIPNSWEVDIAKHVFRQRRDKGNEVCQLLAATQKYGMYPQHLLEGVVKVAADTDLSQFKTVHKNDYVISLRSFQGGFEISDYEGVCSPAYQVFYATRKIDSQYYKYLFKSDAFIQEINSLTVGIREGKNILYDDFALLPIPIPMVSDQQRIAVYLDEKCGEIDSLIGLQEQMIEKLKAYKQSVITEAVTKGLTPNAKLVPSGIDWIGEIPEGWEINKLFNLCTIKGRVGWKGLRSDEFKENSYAYLVTGQDFISSDINWNNCYQIEKERYEEDPYIQLSNGDILVTKDGTIGKIAKVSGMDKPACLNSGIFVLKQRKETFFQNYLYWYLSSPLLLRYNTFINTGGTTIIHLYQNVFERFPMIIPPMDEQITRATYLDGKCSEIDNLIALKQQKIEKLMDYKKSVIYESVTGKTDLKDI